MALRHPYLLAAWIASVLLALGAGSVFVAGVMRDGRVWEPVLSVPFATPSALSAARFRVWGPTRYTLQLSASNFDPDLAKVALRARFEVTLSTPDGRAARVWHFPPESTGFQPGINYSDVELGGVDIDGRPWTAWRLAVLVLEPDPRFAAVATRVRLREVRDQPGMGGLLNYVMVIPTIVFIVIAGVLASRLAAKGRPAPLFITLVVGIPFLLLIAH